MCKDIHGRELPGLFGFFLIAVVAAASTVTVNVVRGDALPATLPAEAHASSPPGPAPAGRPIISVDQPVHDFGTLAGNEPAKHTFIITNRGDADLHISQVRPACGCTAAGDWPRVLSPGQSGQFPFTLTVSGISGDFAKSISIASNDPATPQLQLVLKGKVQRPIEIQPAGAFFGGIYGDKPQSRTLRITSNLPKPLSLALDPFSNEGPFHFELREVNPGREFELTVTTKPPYPAPSTQRAVATIMTNVESQRQLSITAMANAQERLAVVPTTLFVTAPVATAPAGSPLPGQKLVARFNNNGENPVKLLEAKIDDPGIKVSTMEQQAGRLYLIYLDVPAGHSLPPEGRTLLIRTDDREKPLLEVPVRPFTPAVPAQAEAAPGTAPSPADRPAVRPAETMAGRKAPPFSLTTLGGKTVSAESLKGSVAVVNFFAPNCGFCKKQMPRLETLRPAYEARGVRFLYISETMRKEFTTEEIKKTLEELKVAGEVAVDPGNQVGRAWKATSYPTMMVLDREGTIAVVNVGNKADLEDRLKAQLEALLADKPIPPEYAPPRAAAGGGEDGT